MWSSYHHKLNLQLKEGDSASFQCQASANPDQVTLITMMTTMMMNMMATMIVNCQKVMMMMTVIMGMRTIIGTGEVLLAGWQPRGRRGRWPTSYSYSPWTHKVMMMMMVMMMVMMMKMMMRWPTSSPWTDKVYDDVKFLKILKDQSNASRNCPLYVQNVFQLRDPLTRADNGAIVKCRSSNSIGKSEETTTLDIFCKYFLVFSIFCKLLFFSIFFRSISASLQCCSGIFQCRSITTA